jgi:hypothetical protein
MKNLLRILEKFKPVTVIKKTAIPFVEDDFEMEEYHNPFLGIDCYVKNQAV